MRIFKNKRFTHAAYGVATELQLEVSTYHNGRLALMLTCASEGYDGREPYMAPSVNMVDELCPGNEVFIKNYSENEGILAYLIEWGIIEPRATYTSRQGISRYKLTLEATEEITQALIAGRQVLRKQRGGSIELGVFLALVGAATAIILLLVNIDHNLTLVGRQLAMATCHTDQECYNACVALGRGDCGEEGHE